MNNVAPFGAAPSKARQYTQAYNTLMARGRQVDETPQDKRQGLAGAAEFQVDSVRVNTSEDKKQVVLVHKTAGDKVDYNYVPDDVDADVDRQTYRSIMKPDQFGVLHVTERVDSRDSKDKIVASWIREVETDPASEAFSIYFPK